MSDHERLAQLCRRIEGRPYPAWRDLLGVWRLGRLRLRVDHIQGDPYAAPSRVRVRLQPGLSPAICVDDAGRLAAADWLLRRFVSVLDQRRDGGRGAGSGRSGELDVYRPGPEVLRRTAVHVDVDGTVELRMAVGLPARGRRVLGREGHALLVGDLCRAVDALFLDDDSAGGDARAALQRHVDSVRLQRALRDQLDAWGLVAFVADGSVLPRQSGVATGPLAGAVPVHAPDSLAVVLDSPAGPVRGLGIPRGITVITGGGFHGKSTLLQALSWGHLDHVPGDGRERVVALPDTVAVRAEDGRAVAGVDVSAFLSRLPGDIDTHGFSTADASGSTSQAAAIVEAAEAGARLLLLDEDSSATNLLVRDARMRALIPRAHEPITPLVERVRQLRDDWGLSLVLVVGGVGDFLSVADRVIGLMDWRVRDLGPDVAALSLPAPAPPGALPPRRQRRVVGASLRSGRGRVRSRSRRRVEHDGEEVDLAAITQVIDAAHARSLGHGLRVLGQLVGDELVPMSELLDRFERAQAEQGPELLSPWDTPVGDQQVLRRQDLAATLNRLRSLRVEPDIG